MLKPKSISVAGVDVRVASIGMDDYICLTDMLKGKDGEFFFSDWLRNRNTVEFLGVWERVNNPKFNYGEFDIIKGKAGLNSYRLSAKEWMEKTGAIGIVSRPGPSLTGLPSSIRSPSSRCACWRKPRTGRC